MVTRQKYFWKVYAALVESSNRLITAFDKFRLTADSWSVRIKTLILIACVGYGKI